MLMVSPTRAVCCEKQYALNSLNDCVLTACLRRPHILFLIFFWLGPLQHKLAPDIIITTEASTTPPAANKQPYNIARGQLYLTESVKSPGLLLLGLARKLPWTPRVRRSCSASNPVMLGWNHLHRGPDTRQR